MDFSSLRSLFFKWLPFFIIILIVMGMVMFAIRTLVPRWQDHQTISATVEAQRVVVATQLAAQNDTSNQIILQHQIDRIQASLNEAGVSFLLHSEAEELLNRLYNYAYSRGVRVVDLQAQTDTTAAAAGAAAPYDVALYQVQVAGAVPNLIDFVAHFKEASLPAVNIVSMSALSNTDPTTLTMVLQFYTSPFASGQALNGYPTPEPITPTPTPTLIPPTQALTATLAMTSTPVPPTPTPTNTVTEVPYLTPTLVPTLDTAAALSEEVINCPGAQPTLFKVGDIAVVDFNQMGALRVLADPNGPITSTRTQAYDNQRLEIITGPVCANGSYYWYVRNLSLGDALGWVAEGRGDERWLCPESNPECVP